MLIQPTNSPELYAAEEQHGCPAAAAHRLVHDQLAGIQQLATALLDASGEVQTDARAPLPTCADTRPTLGCVATHSYQHADYRLHVMRCNTGTARPHLVQPAFGIAICRSPLPSQVHAPGLPGNRPAVTRLVQLGDVVPSRPAEPIPPGARLVLSPWHKLLVLDIGYALPTYGFDGHSRQWQSSADHTAALLLCAYARAIVGNVLSAAAKPDLPSLAVA